MNSASSLTDIAPVFFIKRYNTYVYYIYPPKITFRANDFTKKTKQEVYKDEKAKQSRLQDVQTNVPQLKGIIPGRTIDWYIQDDWKTVSTKDNFPKIQPFLTSTPRIEMQYIWGQWKQTETPFILDDDFKRETIYSTNNENFWDKLGNIGDRSFLFPLGLFNSVGNDVVSKASEMIFGNFFQDNFVKNHINERSINFYIQQLFKNSFHPILLVSETQDFNTVSNLTRSNQQGQTQLDANVVSTKEVIKKVNTEYNTFSKKFNFKNNINLELFTVTNNLWLKVFERMLEKYTGATGDIWDMDNWWSDQPTNNSIVGFLNDVANAFRHNGVAADTLTGETDGDTIKNTKQMEWRAAGTQNSTGEHWVCYELKDQYKYLINYYGKNFCVLNSQITNYSIRPAEKGNGVNISLQLDASKNIVHELSTNSFLTTKKQTTQASYQI